MLASPTTELLQDAVDPRLVCDIAFKSEAHPVDEQLVVADMADLQGLYRKKCINFP